MILSRANLEVVQCASRDAFDRALNGVQIEADGSTVAGNGRVLMAVGPANEDLAQFPPRAAEHLHPPQQGYLMPVESVLKALSHMSRDKRVQLQHVALSRCTDPARVGFTSVNAKGDPTQHATLPKMESYPDWKKTFRRIDGENTVKVCVNRKDLIDLLKALESACPNRGDANPVFMELSERGMIARCVSHATGQHAVGVLNAYDTKGKWLLRDAWEQRVFGTLKAIKRKLKRRLR